MIESVLRSLYVMVWFMIWIIVILTLTVISLSLVMAGVLP